MGRQHAAVDPPFPRRIGGLRFLLGGLGFGDRLLEVFQRQIELFGVKLGQPLALRFEALRLAQQTTQAVVDSISRSRSAIAASRSATAFNANARSASLAVLLPHVAE